MLWRFLSRKMMALQASSGLQELVEQLVDEVAVRLPSWRHPAAVEKKLMIKPWLEVLLDRIVPSTTWTNGDGNFNASDPGNWSSGLPSATSQAVFDGNTTRVSCVFDYYLPGHELTCNGILVENGYNGVWEVQANTTLSSNATVEIQKGTQINLKIDQGGNPMKLTNGASIKVDAGGVLAMNSNGFGTTFIQGDGKAGEILSNSGSVSYIGKAATSLVLDQIKIPVLNEGTFSIDGGYRGTMGTVGSQLNVSGTVNGTNKKVSWYQDTAAAQTNLSGGASLNALSGYTQKDGLLETLDSYKATLIVYNNGWGTVNIDGGKVAIDPNSNPFVYGSLQFDANTVNCSGEIDIKVNTTDNKTADTITMGGMGSGNGVLNFQTGASFVVLPSGTPQKAQGKWGAVLTAAGGITGWGNVTVKNNNTIVTPAQTTISVTS